MRISQHKFFSLLLLTISLSFAYSTSDDDSVSTSVDNFPVDDSLQDFFPRSSIQECPLHMKNYNEPVACYEIYSPVLGFAYPDGEVIPGGNDCEICGTKPSVYRYIQGSACGMDTDACTDAIDIVCGFTWDGEQIQYHNPCVACQDENLAGYYPGFCLENVYDDGFLGCVDRSPDCDDVYEPVCGYDANGEFEQYSNSCEACANEDVLIYAQGECLDDPIDDQFGQGDSKVECPEPSDACDMIFAPVAGFNQDNESEGYYSNDCVACSNGYDDIVEYIALKACVDSHETIGEDIICPEYYSPVCAVPSNGPHFTVSNDCFACASEEIEYYYEGMCQAAGQEIIAYAEEESFSMMDCDPAVKDTDDLCSEDYAPVCGYTNAGISLSFANECHACKAEDIWKYTQGNCAYNGLGNAIRIDILEDSASSLKAWVSGIALVLMVIIM